LHVETGGIYRCHWGLKDYRRKEETYLLIVVELAVLIMGTTVVEEIFNGIANIVE
jgi:hypothetical protein